MNHRISVDVNGKAVILHFGMSAIRIWQERSFTEIKKVSGTGKVPKGKELLGKLDNVKSFVNLVYAGMCNYQDTLENGVHPNYSDAYAITEEILFMDEQVQLDVWSCFQNSRAYDLLIKRLNELTADPNPEKKSEEAEKPKSVRGTRLK